jgi:hypothetical protein
MDNREWWDVSDESYAAALNEGVIGKAVAGYVGYKVAKKVVPKLVNGAIDSAHRAKDFGQQTIARAKDEDSHNKEPGYRYPVDKKKSENTATKEAFDGFTIDEFGMPVPLEEAVGPEPHPSRDWWEA